MCRSRKKKVHITLLGAALAVLGLSAAGTEELTGFPPSPSLDWDRSNPALWAPIVKSGSVNPLIISPRKVEWKSDGTVKIPFNLNQRARVWVAIYDPYNNETGPRGPFGAWLRFVPNHLFLASISGQDFEAGDNVITWDRIDWEGNPVQSDQHPGFVYDLIGLNILEDATVAGIAPNAGLADPWIDLRTNEVWMGEYNRDAPDRGGHRSGDIARAVLGTDFIANPNAWERWDANSVTDFEGAWTVGGMRGDPDQQDIYYTTHYEGEDGGCYRMIINRDAKTFEPDRDWAENGLAPTAGPDVNIMQMEVWKNNLVAANRSVADPPASSVEFWDKGSGELVKSLDVAEWFTTFSVDHEGNEVARASGPGALSVHDKGIYLSGWRSPNIIMIDHDGSPIWVNRNGDLVGDKVTYELAAETGMTPDGSLIFRINVDLEGRAVFFSSVSSSQLVNYGVLGRDGTGLFNIFADPKIVGPLPLSSSYFITLIDGDRSTSGSSSTWDGPNVGEPGPWDGMYWDTRYDIARHSFERIEGQKYGAGMFLHIPYDLVTIDDNIIADCFTPSCWGESDEDASAGTDTTTVMATVDRASTPASYSLGTAYPNPFNAETTIEFTAPLHSQVRIEVFSTAGQLVATLVDGELSAGSYRTTWNGLDRHGGQVSSGTYFYRMQAGEFTATHSMTLLK